MGDKVRITDGLWRNYEGTIVGFVFNSSECETRAIIRLESGSYISINVYDIEYML